MRLFAYVFWDYIKYVVTTLLLCLFLFVLFDFIHRTTNYFSEFKPTGDLVFKMYLYQLPAFGVQALPIAGLLASVMTMVMLSRTNEISAMRAVGLGPFQIAFPLAVGGMILSLLAIFLGEFVLPRAASLLHHVQEVQIEGGSEHALASSAKWQRKGESVVHFREFDHSLQSMIGLQIMELSPGFRPQRSIYAETARFSKESGLWDAQDVLVTNFNPNGSINYSEGRKSITLSLNMDPKRLTLDRRKPEELSIRELNELIQKGKQSGTDVLSYRVDLHLKIAYPFAAFVVSLIGLNFAFKSERTTETARSVLVAFSIGISYWFILNSVKALGKRGDIHPMVAGWFANFLILAVIVIQAWKGRREA